MPNFSKTGQSAAALLVNTI